MLSLVRGAVKGYDNDLIKKKILILHNEVAEPHLASMGHGRGGAATAWRIEFPIDCFSTYLNLPL